MTTFIKTNINKLDDQTNIDKCQKKSNYKVATYSILYKQCTVWNIKTDFKIYRTIIICSNEWRNLFVIDGRLNGPLFRKASRLFTIKMNNVCFFFNFYFGDEIFFWLIDALLIGIILGAI